MHSDRRVRARHSVRAANLRTKLSAYDLFRDFHSRSREGVAWGESFR